MKTAPESRDAPGACAFPLVACVTSAGNEDGDHGLRRKHVKEYIETLWTYSIYAHPHAHGRRGARNSFVLCPESYIGGAVEQVSQRCIPPITAPIKS